MYMEYTLPYFDCQGSAEALSGKSGHCSSSAISILLLRKAFFGGKAGRNWVFIPDKSAFSFCEEKFPFSPCAYLWTPDIL